MRFGLLIYNSLDTLSGGYLYDRKLVEYLHDQGNEVEIISLPWRNYARHLGDNLLSGLLQRLRYLQVDVLLQDELNHPSLFWLNQQLRKRIPYPIVSIVHHLRCSEMHPDWTNRFYRWVERRYLSSVDGFIYNSQSTRQVVERLVQKKFPAVVAYPGGDHLKPKIQENEIVRRAHQPGPLHLLFLGNVIPRKGLHTLLEALSHLSKEYWTLTVVGSLEVDQAYVRTISHRINTNSLSNNIKLLGTLNQKDLNAQMIRNHVIVVPSTYEGFGIVYLEGMGFGLPAIASNAGAAGEIITQGRNGFLIDPEDSVALSSYLGELSHKRDQLAEMGLAAKHCYLGHPTWENTGEQIYSFLQKLVEE